MDEQDLVNQLRQICAQETARGIRFVKGKQVQFEIEMHNEYLTPTGAIYKMQELRACYTRTITDTYAGLAFLRYTWEAMNFSSSQKGQDKALPWNFAVGQSFLYFLMCGMEVRKPSAEEKENWTEDIHEKLDVSFDYPDLPRTPSVNLLRMLTWDVITFDTLIAQIRSLPALSRVGASAQLPSISNTRTSLGFPQYEGSGTFENNTFEATFLGYGWKAERPCAIYEYKCDGKLSVVANPRITSIGQQGSSFYTGKLLVDVDGGDLIAADMLETIIATITTQEGKKVPTQKRRCLKLECLTGVDGSIRKEKEN